MAKHALEDLDPEFIKTVKPGDIIVGGKNFGCGSSREQAVTCVKEAGVAVVIAVSFARIYFRNCINEGLPALVCPAAVEAIANGESVEVDLAAGTIVTGKGTFAFPPFPPAVQAILSAGGLIPYLKSI